MTAAHCADCDSLDCPGFTTPRATPEPAPPLQPVHLATEQQRAAHLDTIRAELAAVRRRQQEAGR